jgi:predicted site-specific integrase-resolvase
MERLLPAREVAQRLGISIHTLYCWNSQRRIPFIRISRNKVAYRERDINSFINNNLVISDSVYGGNNND